MFGHGQTMTNMIMAVPVHVRSQPLSEDWLVEKFNLDLSLVARLGGHSQPRTHRGKERFPGMTITYALIQMLEKARLRRGRRDAC